jgi:hypothetical protein
MGEQDKQEKQKKKIIVDEDWKHQAQHEKEVLAAKEEADKHEAEEKRKARPPLPNGDFAALLSMLFTQVMYALGLLEVKGHEDQKREPDLEMAKYNIDMLETLAEKTKGNLTKEEETVLKNMLNEVRMAYVKVAG